jgi:hypothetical protein
MKLFRITCALVVLLLSLAAFTFIAVHPAAAQQALNPPPLSFETCKTVGNGTICQGDRTQSYGPVDAGIVCGSGASAFDVFDSATFDQGAKRYYDQNGNLTRRVIHENYSSGQFSNPLTGAVVPYTQHDNITDVLAVPGDISSATRTFTGENIFKPAHGAPVNLNAGRVVTAPDGTIEFRSGPQDFLDYFVNGDTSVIQKLCAAIT